MTESDTDLIRRAQANDLDAFCLLAERYARRIHLLALHYCRNAQDAEDLSQEVWLKAYQALASFRSDSSFYTWLRRITINAFLNHRRSGFFRRRGQTTVVQLLQIDADEVLESQSASPENIYNKLLLETWVRPSGGTWNLWVLHDPNYTPLFGSEILAPKTARKNMNMFEKLGDVLASQGVTFSINSSSKRDPNAPDVPQKVMVGGADSMEHLLPKSP